VNAPTPLLSLVDISRRFGAVQALRKVSLQVRSGEVVALVGDNGAGKSTLIKVMSGIVAPDGGEVLRDGVRIQLGTPAAAMAAGIQTVYQDLALCDALDTVANLFLGRELLSGPLRALNESVMEQRALAVLQGLGVSIPDVRQPVAALSGGQRQCVAVARAVMWNSRVVLLDEPTAALGVAQTAQVLALIRRLREQRLGVVVISHNLADVMAVADRIVVLRLGQNAGEFSAADRREDVVAAITGAAAA